MEPTRLDKRGYVIATLLGAAAGGVMMLVVSNAIPRMMRRMIASMMENMRAQIHTKGCKPEEM